MSDRRIALNYIHAAELFHVMSVNMLWIDVDGKRTPAVEVYVNGGRGPDLVKRMLLTLKDDSNSYPISKVLEFATEMLEGGKKMMQQMADAQQKETDDPQQS